jgi:predicted phage terminase large subunit-like protein
MLQYLATRPDYKSYTFKAIEQEPDNPSIWEEWEKIYVDLDNPNRQIDSDAFYEENREEMEKGARVLWPEKETLKDLQGMRSTQGHFAFNAEKMSDPRNPENQVFFPDQYERFEASGDLVKRNDGTTIKISDMLVFHFLDPAVGLDKQAQTKKGSRDFASVATIGIDNVGKIYVLSVWLDKALPEAQVKAAFDIWDLCGGQIGFESTAFQVIMQIPFEAEKARRGIEHVGIAAIDQHANKTARIMRLEPMFKHGWILLNERLPREFWSQLESFPTASHDDGPDALEGAITFAQKCGALKFAG